MPAPHIRLVIFDCDGVLVDSERLAVRVDVQALASVGWHVTEAEVVEKFVGKSESHARREIEAHIGRALPDDWDHAFRDVAGGLTPAAWLEGADTTVFTDMRELPGLLRR